MRRSHGHLATLLIVCASLCALCTSCLGVVHTVGGGPTGSRTEYDANYYLFWGLWAIVYVDSRTVAGDATSYRVEDYVAFDDLLISVATLGFLSSRTIKLDK
jgi:Bor protein